MLFVPCYAFQVPQHVAVSFFVLLFLISPSFGAPGRPCFMIVAFPVYLYLYFCLSRLGISTHAGFSLAFPSPRWTVDQS